jgi:tyrosine-protein phosphatase SIW14
VRLSLDLMRATVVAALLALSATISAAGPTADGARPIDLTTIHIDNFGRVDAGYYRGAQPEGRDYEDLAALGVKTIVNLTSDDSDPAEKAMAARAGMKYVQIPMSTHRAPSDKELADFLALVNAPANQPVYVHCVGGRHRTGVMTAAYRMSHDGWLPERAFAEMKQYKFGADFLHPEFKDFVYHYRPATAAPAEAAATASSR